MGESFDSTHFIQSLGGVVSTSKAVTPKINYLILGEDPEKGWTALLHGGKLSDAVCRKIAHEDYPLCIVLESHFINCLMDKLNESCLPQL